MKKRIWFNRWFSTAYHFIDAIKHNPDGLEFDIYGTHPNPDTVYFTICDFAESEPVLEGSEYVDYCLDFCKTHRIDVFIPYHHALEISEQLERFREIGTNVMVIDDYVLMKTISHKGKLYESFQQNGLGKFVPDYSVVRTANQFADMHDTLRSQGKKVCIKPADGRGGAGFRVIRDQENTIGDLFGTISHKIAFTDAYHILSSQPTFSELMVMEYLDGFEYSIDCLADKNQLLAAVPRKKTGGRIRELEQVSELIDLAESVNNIYHIPYVYNIQVKYANGSPKLLEINPRMSGGLHISALSGVNFPYLALKVLLKGTATVSEPFFQIKATHIEKAVQL